MPKQPLIPEKRIVATANRRVFTDADKTNLDANTTKLAGIESGATKYPDTGEQAFLDADHSKLDGIEAGATVYPSTGEQAFTDADHSKLDGIEALADVTDAANVAAAGALMTSGGTMTGQIALSSGGLVYVRERPELDYTKITGTGKPTQVYRGVTAGFSLPVYSADDEELFFCIPYVLARWDAASDPILCIGGYLDTANNAKKFKLQASWASETYGTDIIGTSVAEDVVVETTTGNWAQYQSFIVNFTLNYDVLGAGSEMAVGDCLHIRLRRLAASADEIAGEVVVVGAVVKWRLNKFYSSS